MGLHKFHDRTYSLLPFSESLSLSFHHFINNIICCLCSRHWMSVSKPHAIAGEVCGFLTWLWVFYRAKHDLPVVLGLRHPWEHGSDPWAIHYHVEGEHALEEEWDSFAEKSSRPGEADDEDDDDDEEDEEDDEEGDAGDDEDDDE